MGDKNKVDYLLLDIRELEKLVAGMRDAEIYPVSFFSQTFDLTHKILNGLHALEREQIDMLRRQMAEHQVLIDVVQSVTRITEEGEKGIKGAKGAKGEEGAKGEKGTKGEEGAKEQAEEPAGISIAQRAMEPEPVPRAMEPMPAEEKHARSLHEVLEKQNLVDFRKAFSLNDRFYFRKELFSGDEAKMNKVVSDLNDIHSYEESIAYLNEKLNWNIEDPTVAEFLKLLEKRFL